MSQFKEMYKQKLTTADEAVKHVLSGTQLVSPLANGEPPALMEALAQRMLRDELRDIQLFSALQARPTNIYLPQLSEKGLQVDSGYVGPVTRWGVQQGIFSYSPNHLSEVSSFIWRCHERTETVVYVVSPMDEHGYFTTGTHCDWAWEVAKRAPSVKYILVEVNENMPRTHGNNSFHISEVTAVVENHVPLVQLPEIPISKEDEVIGQYIADQVPDEACIQLGIGGVPNAVAHFLSNKRDLGVHTEMLTDSMVDLYEKGVITCAKKNYATSKMLASFALGSQKLYDFVNDNTMVQFFPTSFVNNPKVIGRNRNVVSINATLEVDLTGQCASESIGHMQYSGTGGQVDFVRGAWQSKGGKSFLALYSTYTDKEGKLHTKIKPSLTNGAVVTTTRTDVQNVVTEYGIAALKGHSMAERARRLIAIAHPDFRDELRFEAKKLCIFQ
ncbi:MAG: acetyl-CoA hydrolase/transferase family protein [Candidatus Saccharibacteria bacterium]